jgi:rhamnosyltransferase
MRISVIIPTLNAGAQIENLLSRLSTQSVKPAETIIIDSSSDDGTAEVAQGCGAKIMIIPRKDFDHGGTRNLAAGKAEGDILLFMTQDALPFDNSLVVNLTAPLADGEVVAAYGRHIPRPDASPPEVFARQFNYTGHPLMKSMNDLGTYGIKTFFFSNVCSAVKRDIFFHVGMFPEGVRSNEDMLLAAKLILGGQKVAYVPDARVVHSHAYSLFQLFTRYYNIGSSLKNNSWVLKHARSEGEGLRFMKEELCFLLDRRRYAWLPYVFMEALAKYAGYRIGLLAG